jgi:hypothetical protein
MAKQTDIKVDEEYLMSMMAGDVPSVRRQLQEPQKASPQKESAPPPRRKKEPQDYESRFLKKRESSERRQTYISREIYRTISRFLPVIGSEISITAYLDNILLHHLEQYRDEINELYERNYKKPFGNGKE